MDNHNRISGPSVMWGGKARTGWHVMAHLGTFDAGMGKVISAWDIHPAVGTHPTREALEAAMADAGVSANSCAWPMMDSNTQRGRLIAYTQSECDAA